MLKTNETIIITLNDPQVTGITLGAATSVTFTIQDNDTHTVACANDNSISLENGSCTTRPTFLMMTTWAFKTSELPSLVQSELLSNLLAEHELKVKYYLKPSHLCWPKETVSSLPK